MQTKIGILTLVGIICVTAIIYLNTPSATITPTTSNEISGAYQALSSMGAQRAYPFRKIPDKAHFAAWEKSQSLTSVEKGNPNTESWESIGPHNVGGRTLGITLNPLNPQTIYLGSASGGLWRSYTAGDGEQAWHRVATGFPVLGVSSIAIDPADTLTMYIGTGEVYNHEAAGTGAAFRSTRGSYGIGILKTTDGGVTWQKSLDWTYAQNHGVWTVKIDPTAPQILWAATTDGTYKSSDAGASWQKVLDVVMATDLIIHPNQSEQIIVACGNLGSPNRGIYKSIDGGQNWTKSTDTTLPVEFQGKIMLGYAPSNPDIVYASIGNGFGFNDGITWLVRSDDFGEDWVLKNMQDYSQWQGWFAHDVAVHPSNPDRITCIGIEIWQSDNGGSLLEKISDGGGNSGNPSLACSNPSNFVHSDAHDVVYHPTDSDIIYIAHDGGFSKSLDGGNTFSTCIGGYQTVQFYNGFSSAETEADLSIGGLQDNGTIVYDGDKRWHAIGGGDGSWSGIDANNEHIQYLSSQFLNIYRTFDGQDFDYITPPIEQNEITAFIAPYRLAPNNSGTLYAGAERVYKSEDYGASWIATSQPLDNNPILCMDVAPENADVVYVATAPYISEPSAFVTTDGGTNWTEISDGLPNRYPLDISIDPNDEATAYITFSGFDAGHVFKTSDYGSTWIDISDDLPDVPTNAVIIDPLNSNHVYIGNDIGVFVSEDGGQTWQSFQDGLPMAVMAFDLSISPLNRKLRLATHGNGAYQRDLLFQEDVSTTSPDIKMASLQVFPNPTSDIVQVRFLLEKATPISVEIHQIDGKQIFKQDYNNISLGWNTLSPIDVHQWASGTYILTLQTNQQRISKKINVQEL